MNTAEIILSSASEETELTGRREDLAELEESISKLEPGLVQLQIDMRAFESCYLSALGSRYNQLAEIEKEIAKIQGLDPDEIPEMESLAEDEVGCGQNRLHSDKLKKLYRDVARKFHPDLTSCEHERLHRHQLMIEVNRAYEAGAENRLQELLEAGEGLEATESKSMSAEMILLLRRIAQARERLVSIQSDIEEITSSEIYKLKLRVENAREFGVDLFGDLISQVDRQIKKAENRLEHLRSVMLTG